ncbi:hypothetical protein ACFQI7_03895 [Paenibacillus allorhizosphaerae]|uniref:DUF4177 domain-containing protein n=1 Tax=Paenibacillus allorhizosphaerae TaxID=2849866 RepID=A0ABM8VCU9_9BACL|nr:hypothetical protein [Paenibacillus allorhizosphaerae]CAG7624291.1 hypothetical protein PAECIP111802_01046 [Paenibacillus allorhizosphaerae]
MNEAGYIERRIEIVGVFEIPISVSPSEFRAELHAVFQQKGWDFKGFTADITAGRERQA